MQRNAPPPETRALNPLSPRRAAIRAFLILGLPGIAILGGIPVLDRSHAMLFGMPVLLDWLFLWFVGTTLCLWAGWALFDRDRTDEDAS